MAALGTYNYRVHHKLCIVVIGGILLYPTAYTSTKKHFEQFWDGLVQSCVRKLNIF